jgi:transcriptional regulator with XRE-family HTH domain
MALGGSPVGRERKLRAELRLAREQANLTQKDVAEKFGWHPSKVIRIEAGAVSIDVADLMALLHHYGVTDHSKVDELVTAARESKDHVWWDDYRKHFSSELITYISYEASAMRLRQFQALTIPGILQTEEYARSIIRVFGTDTGKIERGVELRLARQRILERPNPPEMFFIVDEAAIRRQVGGVQVMAAQLRHLKELSERPNINIQVVPFSAGGYRGMRGSFSIFEFAGEDEDFVVFFEQTFRNVLIKTPEETSSYVETFFDLEQIARPAADFGQFVDRMMSEL